MDGCKDRDTGQGSLKPLLGQLGRGNLGIPVRTLNDYPGNGFVRMFVLYSAFSY